MTRSATAPDLHESVRLKALHSIGILDTPAEQAYDDLTRLAACVCRAPFALISLVDEDRLWFKSSVGFPLQETPRNPQNFCVHAIEQDDVFIVPDARLDARFQENPFVSGAPSIRFYAGMALTTPERLKIGTLCVLDREPRDLDEQAQTALRVLARQVSAQIQIHTQVKELQDAAILRENLERELRLSRQELAVLKSCLQELAAADELTGLKNRRSFDERLQHEWQLSLRSGNAISVLVLDIDYFKRINDTFGHGDGDQVLKHFANLLPTVVRSTDLVARYGGEEFAVLLPNVEHARALVIAEKMRKIASLKWKGYPVTVSVGVSTCVASDRRKPQAALVETADRALYVAKNDGRNRVQSAASVSHLHVSRPVESFTPVESFALDSRG